MFLRKRFLFLTALLSLAFPLFFEGLGASAEVKPAYDPSLIDYPGTKVVFHVAEQFPFFKSDIGFSETSRVSSTQDGRTVWCQSTKDPDCLNLPNGAYARTLLPFCSSPQAENCIEDLAFSVRGAEFEKASYVRELNGYTIPADPELNFIGGKSASIWRAPNAKHVGQTDNYLVAGVLFWNFETKEFTPNSFQLSVIPFNPRQGAYAAETYATEQEMESRARNSQQWVGFAKRNIPKVVQGGLRQLDCFVYDDGMCGIKYDFEDNVKVKATIRLPNKIGGWFRGRMLNPEISVKKFSDTNNLVTVEANPVQVPRLAYLADYYSLSPNDEKLYVDYFWGRAVPEDLLAGPEPDSGERAFGFIDKVRENLKDTATGYTTFWNFTSTQAGRGSSCLTDTSNVLGIVSTNAMAFEATAPRFNGETLDYKVAGLHYAPGAISEVKGTYDLVMRSETARCLYGFSNAPISATVSVTSESGEPAIATTTISEKDGWLKLGAQNFTFSAPTVRVKLEQKIEKAPEPIAAPQETKMAEQNAASTAIPTPAKKIKSITCTKGKSSRKVSGVNPKCPAGYKKK